MGKIPETRDTVTPAQYKMLLGNKPPRLGAGAWPAFEDEESNSLSTQMGMAEAMCSANLMQMKGVRWSPLMAVLNQ